MQYSTLLALLSAPLLALAQDNAFQIPKEGLSASAGEPLTLKWDPTTDGTVSLILRSGSSNNLNEGTEIASGLQNSGSYTWTPTNALTRGSDYTIEIVDDNDPSNVNYTPYFVLDTTNTVAQPTSIISLGNPTTRAELSTASATGAATSLTSIESLVTSTASAAQTNSAASGASSGSSASTTGSGSSASQSAGSAASSGASSASQAAGSASASSSDLNAPEQSGNAGNKKTAMVGVLGAVALGAFAL